MYLPLIRFIKKELYASQTLVNVFICQIRNYFGNTAWKVFKYGVISASYFPVFGFNTVK